MANIFPVILSGGSGTRLWPLSRSKYPKQFIRFGGNQGLSFLQAACLRLPAGGRFGPPTLLCNEDHRFLVREQLQAIAVAPRRIILEPVARNTAPAVIAAALSIAEQDREAVMAVMPSDHAVEDHERFADCIAGAARAAGRGRFILFGIEPDRPRAGYGYIRRGRALNGRDPAVSSVEVFVEKPDETAAARFLEEGGYCWNSGIFVLPVAAFLEEAARLEPDMVAACEAALNGARKDLDFLRLDKTAFSASPALSIDVAIMERTSRAAVMPLDAGWSDVGSWTSLWNLAERDESGNAVVGTAILEDTRDCYIHSSGSVMSAIGVENLVIVETPDAVLVSDADRAQEVPKIVERIARSNRNEHESHMWEHRPWGYFETLRAGPRFQVKLLHVEPKARLSLQMHHHRCEHWVVVKGVALVTTGGKERLVRENESFFISSTDWHRLENPGKIPLEIIEVQTGAYLGEDDIVRCDDEYGRVARKT